MPYKIEIRSILESLSASRDASGSVVVPDLAIGEQGYRFDGPVEFDVTLTNAGAGVVVAGVARARVLTSCVRCLCDMCLEVEAEVEGFYVRPADAKDLPDEQEVEFIADDSTIDLEPAITQSVVVEMPFAPLHDAECKGICAVCGSDRNVSGCSCAERGPASPFDMLKDLDLGPENPS